MFPCFRSEYIYLIGSLSNYMCHLWAPGHTVSVTGSIHYQKKILKLLFYLVDCKYGPK